MAGFAFVLLLSLVMIPQGPQALSSQVAYIDPVRACMYESPHGNLTLNPFMARVAAVIPTFTLTPYDNFNTSFYRFYLANAHVDGFITSGLQLLSTRVTDAWSPPKLNDEWPLFRFLESAAAARCGLVAGANLSLIDDVAVNSGALFSNGSRAYDVVILGHEEYVTAFEYSQFRQFVADGGRIVAMSGNTFYAEVSYSNGIETFVGGHGFQFDGSKAWRSTYKPFDEASLNWFGSAFDRRARIPLGAVTMGNTTSPLGAAFRVAFPTGYVFDSYNYSHREMNYLGNFSHTEVIARFFSSYVQNGTSGPAPNLAGTTVDAYVHWYHRGEVDCLCVFGEHMINGDPEAKFFLLMGVSHGFYEYLKVPGGTVDSFAVPASYRNGGNTSISMTANFIWRNQGNHLVVIETHGTNVPPGAVVTFYGFSPGPGNYTVTVFATGPRGVPLTPSYSTKVELE